MNKTDCTHTQERIALGQGLTSGQRAHLAECQQCGVVAEAYSLLDASLDALAEPVPHGFADRVMSRLELPTLAPAPRWFEAAWVELALANVALVCAVLNTVRFLAGVLLPSVSLGGTP